MAITQVRIARAPLDGRLFVAYTDGDLHVQRYDDADPPAVADTVTVDSGSIYSCSLGIRGDGKLDLFWTKEGAAKRGDLYWSVSTDQGATWAPAVLLCDRFHTSAGSTTLHPFYGVAHCIGFFGTLLLFLSYSAQAYCSSMALLSADGASWDFGDGDTDWLIGGFANGAAILHPLWTAGLTAGYFGGDVVGCADGGFEAANVGQNGLSGGDARNWAWVVRNRALNAASGYVSDWSGVDKAENVPDVNETGDVYTAFAVSEKQGLAAYVVRMPATGTWRMTTGVRSGGTIPWVFGSMAPTPGAAGAAAGAGLLCRADGVWEFAFANPAGGISILRCTALAADGTGTWV